MKATLNNLRENKLREKEDYENMLIVMKKEDDVRKQLRNVSLRINRS